jgi:NAD+ kinase
MMKVFILPNSASSSALDCARRVSLRLTALGAKCGADTKLKHTLEGEFTFGATDELVSACDIVMPIGGDGTVMRSAKIAKGKPILGVNAGRLGFLTQLEAGELEPLDVLVTGNYSVCRRMMLDVSFTENSARRHFTALNDVVLTGGKAGAMTDMKITRAGKLIARQRADSLIFSTPTGSTAYSMAAGGPITEPGMDLIIMSAVCPHSTFNRSLVLPAKESYLAGEDGPRRFGIRVMADGKSVGKLAPNEIVTIKRSRYTAQFIDLGLATFYDRVNSKLMWQ